MKENNKQCTIYLVLSDEDGTIIRRRYLIDEENLDDGYASFEEVLAELKSLGWLV